MNTDFPTAPLASGLRGASGGAVEKSLSASHTKILTLPFGAQTAFFTAITVSQFQLIALPKVILPLGLMLVPTIIQAGYIAQLKEPAVSPLHRAMSIWTVIVLLIVTAYFLYTDFTVVVTALQEFSVAAAIYSFVLTMTTLLVERRKKVAIFFSSAKGYEFRREF